VKIKKKNLKNIFLVKTVMKVLYVQIIHICVEKTPLFIGNLTKNFVKSLDQKLN
jgi:hypothetical protein